MLQILAGVLNIVSQGERHNGYGASECGIINQITDCFPEDVPVSIINIFKF